MHGFAHWLETTSASHTVQTVSWLIPLLQSIHIVMIGIVFISSLMIALRVLGRVRADEPFTEVWGRFAPWMWTGLIVMALTGLMLVVGEPTREFTALSFWMKMALLALGISATAVYGHSLKSRPDTEFSAAAKAASIGIVVLWLAVIFLGRAIAYDKEVWGTLSLHA